MISQHGWGAPASISLRQAVTHPDTRKSPAASDLQSSRHVHPAAAGSEAVPEALHTTVTCRRSAAAEEAPSPDTPEEPTEAFGRAPSAGGLESVPLPEGIAQACSETLTPSMTLPRLTQACVLRRTASASVHFLMLKSIASAKQISPALAHTIATSVYSPCRDASRLTTHSVTK